MQKRRTGDRHVALQTCVQHLLHASRPRPACTHLGHGHPIVANASIAHARRKQACGVLGPSTRDGCGMVADRRARWTRSSPERREGGAPRRRHDIPRSDTYLSSSSGLPFFAHKFSFDSSCRVVDLIVSCLFVRFSKGLACCCDDGSTRRVPHHSVWSLAPLVTTRHLLAKSCHFLATLTSPFS
jgi:hypothetical protein